jgi:hypothetical protein
LKLFLNRDEIGVEGRAARIVTRMKFNTLVVPRLTDRDGALAGIGAVAGAAIVAPGLAAPVLAGMLVWMGTNALGFVFDRITGEVEGTLHCPQVQAQPKTE